MSNIPFEKQTLADTLIKNSNGRLDRKSLESAMNGNTGALLDKLSSSDRDKINRLLNDRKALDKLLSGTAARQLMRKLSENGK